MNKTIGIIGGMGPLATCDLFRKIIDITDAASDQEHIRVCIDNNTEIPDRTKAIIADGTDPVEQMSRSAKGLQAMGADVLIMPCNTAHYFHARVAETVNIPLLNMLEETAKYAKQKGISRVGLLATDGTIRSGVYAKAFEKEGIEICTPSAENQQAVMDVIYKGVKAGNYSLDLTGFYAAIDEVFAAGAETLILGCTELPVAFDMFRIEKTHIDPTLILAAAAVKFVDGKLKENVL